VLRILIISDHADPLAKIGSKEAGGQNVYVANIAALLAKLGHGVDVYTRWDSASKREVVQPAPHFRVIRVKAGPKKYIPRDTFLSVVDEFVDNVKQRIAQEHIGYDIVFSHYWFSGVAGLRLARYYGIPQTHIYHSIGQIRRSALEQFSPGGVDKEFFAIRASWEQRIARQSRSLIATSPMERDNIVRLFGVERDKIAVIPIGVDTEVFRPYRTTQLRHRLAGHKRPIVLYVGRLEWAKGVSTLIKAMKKIVTMRPGAQLWVIGGGDTRGTQQLDLAERRRLTKEAVELGLEGNVQFLGAKRQSEVARYYAAADVCVMPSYYESFGIVPIEAMACGTPVVASRTGAAPFTIKEGVTGYLVTPRDADELATKLATVIECGKDAYRLATRRRALEKFSWLRIAGYIADHLSGICGVDTGQISKASTKKPILGVSERSIQEMASAH